MSKNKSKFMVLSKDGDHEYDIVVKDSKQGKKFSLYLSNGSQWISSAKGQLELTMLDTGDEVIFDGDLGTIDYCQLTYLRLLIGLEQELDSNPKNREKYKLINGKKIIKL